MSENGVLMSEQEAVQKAIVDGVHSALQPITLSPSDFKEGDKASTATPAHDKILMAVDRAWRERWGFGQSSVKHIASKMQRGGGAGIDFIGRKAPKGKILLAVEVDTRWNENSWLKLADIKANTKVWVFIYPEEIEEKPQGVAKEALSYFLKNYGGIKDGEVWLFIKTPTKLFEERVP